VAFEYRQAAQLMQMVNAGFPPTIRYGFEMVDAAWAARLPLKPASMKIYAESNHANFQRIFEELTSMQTLAIY